MVPKQVHLYKMCKRTLLNSDKIDHLIKNVKDKDKYELEIKEIKKWIKNKQIR